MLTKRLKLLPLSLFEFDLLINNPEKLTKKLKLNEPLEGLDYNTLFAMKWLYKQCKTYPEHHIWYTNWQIIRKSDNISVGSFCFKGEPDINGEVEIGYGIYPKYQKQGYMTETIEGIIKFALKNDNVKSIIAETAYDNVPSQNVLQKHGFIKYSERYNMFWWRKNLV